VDAAEGKRQRKVGAAEKMTLYSCKQNVYDRDRCRKPHSSLLEGNKRDEELNGLVQLETDTPSGDYQLTALGPMSWREMPVQRCKGKVEDALQALTAD
jgi:hypothetical protein